MNRKLITTSDGSQTIFVEELNETYHSIHGAIQEANHVFIDKGLRLFKAGDKVKILEVGFGTGLNALLTWLNARKLNLSIDYVGVEAYPVEDELIDSIDYYAQLEEGAEECFKQLHKASWNVLEQLDDCFSLLKLHAKVESIKEINSTYDLIYFDAFGPNAQSELWNSDVLQKMNDLLKPNGILVTYCAKGQVKRDLKSVGFTIEALPGPPGKREMTRAIKTV